MYLISAKAPVLGISRSWVHVPLMLNAEVTVTAGPGGEVWLHVWRKRRFLPGRQLQPLGRLEANLAARVHPLLVQGARVRVRLVDVPAPFDRARQAQVRMSVSIWTDGSATSTATAARPDRERSLVGVDCLRPDPPAS